MIKLSEKTKARILGNAQTKKDRKARRLLIQLLEAGLAAAQPEELIRNCVKRTHNKISFSGLDSKQVDFRLSEIKNIYVIGPGKANGAMAEELERILGDRITEGQVIIHEKDKRSYETEKIVIDKACHPLPCMKGVTGAEKTLEIASNAKKEDLVICLISGGGSALMPLPPDKIPLRHKVGLTKKLLRAGANIKEINVVRKHLSLVKGGRLARAAYPAKVVALILSDVVGDDISSIASGPTAPDLPKSTFREAINILKRYNLWGSTSKPVRNYLTEGARRRHPETPKGTFRNVHNIIIGNNNRSVVAIHQEAKKRKLNAMVLSHLLEGEAREIGKLFSGVARSICSYNDPLKRPAVVIAGGETTVTVKVKKKGVKGGRNQELALSAALVLDPDLNGVAIAGLASDGKEAFTNAAGAIVDAKTVKRAKGMRLVALNYLLRNNSYSFFRKLNDLLITSPSPSGTNINDFVILCVL